MSGVSKDTRRAVRRLAQDELAGGRPTGWFEPLYARAGFDPTQVPWADLAPNPGLAAYAVERGLTGDGRSAVVVGCGLGDDAEALAALGFEVTAFDLSPTAIAWCRRRFPATQVHYLAADLFAPPASFAPGFGFVLEVYTVQALPPGLQADALSAVARLVAPGGTLLLISGLREGPRPTLEEGPPWALTEDALAPLGAAGLEPVAVERYVDDEGSVRLRAEYRAPAPQATPLPG